MKKIALTTLAVLIFLGVSNAQTSVSHTISVVAHPILDLKLENASVTPEFNFRTLSDYENGIEKLNAAELKVKANKNWILNVSANSGNFLTSSNGQADFTSSVLSIRNSGQSNNVSLQPYNQAVATGHAGGAELNKILLDYIANPGFISPDSYSIQLTYTLTAP